MHELRRLHRQGRPEDPAETTVTEERAAIDQLLTDFLRVGETGQWVALFPPAASRPPESHWLAPADVTHMALRDAELVDGHAAMTKALVTMVRSLDQPEAFALAARDLSRNAVELASARGEYDKIGLEVTYHKWSFFFWSLVVYVVSFLVLAVSWLRPRSRWLVRTGAALVGLGTLPLLVGIVFRCIIRSRPPITGLYDTILFITAMGVILALVIELINRRRIALPIAAFLGIAGMFLAGRYEVGQGTDTMPRLVAVLDTNFWLSTHVTTVTAGYAAGLLAGLIGHVYILGRMLGLRRGDRSFYSQVSRMAYGVLCFGLVFSVVGTILGGIWANDSWGRFWGWDPKENGALMICLWGIAVLHARMGGYIRELGMAVASVVLACIVVFSWWGVNMLGVGLHSYGFTEGMAALYWFYGFELLVLSAAAAVHLRGRSRLPAPAPPPRPAHEG